MSSSQTIDHTRTQFRTVADDRREEEEAARKAKRLQEGPKRVDLLPYVKDIWPSKHSYPGAYWVDVKGYRMNTDETIRFADTEPIDITEGEYSRISDQEMTIGGYRIQLYAKYASYDGSGRLIRLYDHPNIHLRVTIVKPDSIDSILSLPVLIECKP